jgi:D-alanyl-D-alanine carboxypeptidase (penicillin-binding protein 5/6)
VKKLFGFLFILLLCFFAASTQNFCFAASAIPETSAKAMVLMDMNSKRILAQKHQDVQLPMASTTKVMTAYTVLKRCSDLKTKVKVDKRAVGIEGTSMYLQKDEVVTIEDLLYGMMIASGNDAACALALHFAGSISEFANIMNNDAREIGAVSSNFTNPHGLDEKGHFTTAHDLAIIMSHAMKNEFFAHMVAQKTVIVKGAGGEHGDTRLLVNKNRLLGNFEHCTGGKIGFTDNAGRCLVSTASKNGLDLVCVVLNCPDMFLDSKNLLQYGLDNYVYTQLLEPYKVHRKIMVEDGKENQVKIYTKRGFSYPLTLDESMSISFEFDIPSSIKAPVEKEQAVGKYIIKLDNQVIFEETLYCQDQVKSILLGDNIKEIVSNW